MVTREAKIVQRDENYYLELALNDKNVEIPLTEDKQNDVKEVFNELIIELKKGNFKFSLINDENNLYFQISKEYIKQLNSEMNAVYTELVAYDLLEKEAEEVVEVP